GTVGDVLPIGRYIRHLGSVPKQRVFSAGSIRCGGVIGLDRGMVPRRGMARDVYRRRFARRGVSAGLIQHSGKPAMVAAKGTDSRGRSVAYPVRGEGRGHRRRTKQAAAARATSGFLPRLIFAAVAEAPSLGITSALFFTVLRYQRNYLLWAQHTQRRRRKPVQFVAKPDHLRGGQSRVYTYRGVESRSSGATAALLDRYGRGRTESDRGRRMCVYRKHTRLVIAAFGRYLSGKLRVFNRPPQVCRRS